MVPTAITLETQPNPAFYFTDTDFAESVLSFLRNTAFNFYKVGHFSPVLTFSSAQFEITKVKKFTTANVLFGVSSVQQLQGKLSGVSARDLFTLFANRNIDFSFATYNYNENEMFKLLAKGVLQKLGTVILDKHQFSNPNEDKMYCPSKSKPKPPSDIAFDMDWLGIGNPSTWHGYPDARFRIKNNDTLMLAHNDLEEGTPGNSLLLEAKNDERLMQLVATTVVASFTEKNLHKDLDDIIPTVMIMPTSAIICVYDVTQDYLMISDKFEWLAKDEDDNYIFNKPGFILLWMALNHR